MAPQTSAVPFARRNARKANAKLPPGFVALSATERVAIGD
jgi:hypothetical protein